MCQGIRTQAASTKCESSIRFERSRNRWIKPAGSSSAVLNQYASEPYHRTVSEELSSDLPDARFSSGDAIKIHNWPASESITNDTPLVRDMSLGGGRCRRNRFPGFVYSYRGYYTKARLRSALRKLFSSIPV